MAVRTPAPLYPLISNPWLRRYLGNDNPVRDVRWVLPSARRVVEVGAAAGYYTGALARYLGADAELTAIDPDPGSVDLLRCAGEGRFEAVCADGVDLPFASASVDAALYGYSLEEFNDPTAGLREAARVIRPGGQLVLFLWRVNLLGSRRVLRSPAMAAFRPHFSRVGPQNLRFDLRRLPR